MKIAFLVLAHDRPAHLGRLVGAICDKDCRAFVHIDAKSDIGQFELPTGANAQFTKRRIPVYWGEYSQVEAILLLMEEAKAYKEIPFDYFVLLSGADYPIFSLQQIKAFFEQADTGIFIDTEKMPSPTKPLKRLRRFIPSRDMALRRKLYELSRPLFQFLVRRPYKRSLAPFTPFGGGTWWALPVRAVDHVIEMIEQHQEMVNFFKNTICPDEMFFQTILCNWADVGSIKPALTYTDWTAGGSNPAMISQDHVDVLKSDGAFRTRQGTPIKRKVLFARKFPDDSQELVKQIQDLQIARKD
ncbi:MAG: beta-1,6-N-acetylglucosaminyltransferase [Marinosulfonomonas sp.]